ncbi:nitrogenase iron-molybdenum cofactor biosynthesis protein NifE [Actinotalea sp. M2MS4P-6]|uniref:nitrogenase iron-molybdenum cofactor biosynthesis protein NifE n=1 Tax=Actinotalea sp. M2MS4P-6 TaxID=2983762 RepID=UPI0021E372CD|nr:nitrogenase iron-molybdenum cofactor biosynthesis protein NifE [Actinotalea sp. M2MS4P-6]MCV2393851.1 nitrogenase iron-molybdenum cofactor biosynthesis protein NifE [Actinotalea sp. M2MS4P-6]
MTEVLAARARQVARAGTGGVDLDCDRQSTSGSVSQRACTFCGSRVVLYPIADAIHLVHGPIGCAVYTWDIRGALSSGPELHRLSFSTDLRERHVVFGGERQLEESLDELIARHSPRAAFVYATCIVGVIGDDVDAVCRAVSERTGIPVIPVRSEGFQGSKRKGYDAACEALMSLVGTGDTAGIPRHSVNLLGDFNLAGEIWIIQEYLRRMGVTVVANLTGDGRVDDIRRAHGAGLNLVQCSGSTTRLAQQLRQAYGTPFQKVSYFGLDDMAAALYGIAEHFKDPEMLDRTRALVAEEIATVLPVIDECRADLEGKRAAIYVGGAFKAISLVKALRLLGVRTALVGSQTGTAEDYRYLAELCDPGTVIVDDSNPAELSQFMATEDVDLFIGGVKERPMAYKMGVAFCDHNHERKVPLEGFVGMANFAREVRASVCSPVWQFTPRRARAGRSGTTAHTGRAAAGAAIEVMC